MKLHAMAAAAAALLCTAAQAAPKEIFLKNIHAGEANRVVGKDGSKSWTADVNLEFETESGKMPSIDASRLPGGWIEITPAVKDLTVNRKTSDEEIRLSGGFEPGTNYLFTVRAGLRDARGAELARDARISHTFKKSAEDFARFVYLGEALYMPLKSAEFKLPMEVCGKDAYTFKLKKAYENNFGTARCIDGLNDDRFVEIGSFKRVLASADECVAEPRFLDLKDFPGFRAEPGLYFVHCQGEKYDFSKAALFLTDIAIQAVRSSLDETWGVAATRISDGSPVAGAEIAFVTRNNQYLPAGRTGKDGTLKAKRPFPSVSGVADKAEITGVTARYGADAAYLALGDATHKHSNQYQVEKLARPRAFVHFDRGICRPGDTFTASAIVRDAANAPLRNVPCTFEARGPMGRVVGKTDLRTDRHGFATCDFAIPSDAASGIYYVSVRPRGEGVCDYTWGDADILVSAYTPDRIRVSLDIPKGPADAAASVAGSVSAEYYFGAKIPSASWNCKACFSPWASLPAAWGLDAADGEWTVGDRKGWDSPNPWHASEDGNPALPAQGKAGFEIPSFASLGGKAYRPFTMEVVAQVGENGGNTVSATERRTVYPAPWFAAAREKDGFLELRAVEAPGREAEAAKAVDAQDAPPVLVKFYKVEWNPHLERTGSGRFNRVWTRDTEEAPQFAASVAAKSLKGAGMRHSVSALPEGAWEAVVSCGGSVRTRIEFFRSSGSPVARSADPSILKVKSSAPSYKPGDTAVLKVRSMEDATAFVACGQKRFDSFAAVDLKKGDNEIKIKIPGDTVRGKYYAGVTVAAKASARNRSRLFALAELAVDQSAHALNAKIEVPAKARPGDKAVAKVRVTRADGSPAAGGMVRLQLSDSGVLALTRFATPDPFLFFWKSASGNPFSFADAFGCIYPELRIMPDGRFGGGDDTMPFNPDAMTEKPAVRVILPPAELGPNGTAEVQFEVPDHLGELRVMAAATCDDADGGGEAAMAVAREYDMTLSAPRFAFPSDSFTATATVFNNTDKPADYVFTMSGAGSLETEAAQPRTGSLAPGASALLRQTVRAKDIVPGAASMLAMKLEIPAAGVKVEKSSPVLVRPPRPPVLQTSYARLAPGRVYDSSVFAARCIGAYTGECAVASSPAIALAPALKWLREYRFGCLEQTASTALPFIAAPELARLGVTSGPDEAATLARRVDAAAIRVRRCIRSDGFSMWPEPGCDWSWDAASLQAAAFLAEASRRPASADSRIRPEPVPPETLRWLYGIACSRPESAAREGGQSMAEFRKRRERRALAAWIMARAGDMRGLNTARGILARESDTFAAFAAAAALATGGYASEAMPFMKSLLAGRVWRNGAHTDLFGASAAARMGFVLSAISELPPELSADAAAEIVPELLLSARMGREIWGGTFMNGWAAYGLARYAATCAADTAAGAKTAKFAFKSGSDAVYTNGTSGTVWVRTVIAGTPSERIEAGCGIKLVRTYTNTAKRPGGRIFHGDLVKVTISASGEKLAGGNFVVTDLVPAGFEIEDPSLATRAGAGSYPDGRRSPGAVRVRCEKRDDRCHFIFDVDPDGHSVKFEYMIRACTRGCFATGDASLGAMYDAGLRATAEGGERLVVE